MNGTDTSRTVALLSDARDALRTAASRATLLAVSRVGGDRLAVWSRDSRVYRSVRLFETAVRSSALFGWLTAEPEADVVVVDLRETATVGPVLAVLDWLFERVARYWRGARTRRAVDELSGAFAARPVWVTSTIVLVAVVSSLAVRATLGSLSSRSLGLGLLVASLALAGTRVTASLEELTGTSAFEVAVTILSPPEPPERNEHNGDPPE